MELFHLLFGGKKKTEEEKKERKERNNFDVLKYDGAQALRMGKTDYAVACFVRAIGIRDDEETRRWLAAAYMQTYRLEDAAEQYASLCALDAANASYPLALADVLFQLERYEEMERACGAALAIDGRLAMPRHLLAKGAKAQGQDERAVQEATAALAVRDDYAEARLLRAEAYAALQRYAEAEQDVERLLQAGAVADEVLLLKAAICGKQGKYGEAASFYREAIAQNPFIPSAYAGLRDVCRLMGDDAAAERAMADAVEQLGTTPEEAAQSRQDGPSHPGAAVGCACSAPNPFQPNAGL